MLTDDFASTPPEGIDYLSEKVGPILALLDALDVQYKQGKSLRVGEYLHLFMIAVTHQHTGSKVAQNLIQACLENGIRKGYKAAVTEATGVFSQHTFRKCGFVDRIEISYKTFTYHGKRVFATIEGHTGTILMDKALV
jgi:predicted N-acetyltransferase YhbS